MTFETLLYEVRDGVAHVTLNREEAANALNLAMAKDLMQASLQADEDPAVRAVLLGARGRMFCAGGDLGSFSAAGDAMPALLKEMTTYLHAAVSRLARMRAPVIAAVGGTAAGAGFSLAVACDLVVASETAKFTMAYTNAGLTPDGSSTWYLPRIIGTRRTLELMITNRVLGAAEAAEWGLVNQVVAPDALAADAEALATRIAAGPTAAYGALKKLVVGSFGESLEAQMELEARAIADASRTADAQAGIRAFFDKRAAAFTGS